MKRFFITSTGTSIGKTLTTCSLIWQLRKQGKKVRAIKPVISGYNPADMECDPANLLKSNGITPTPEGMAAISPWRYTAALAPNMAAAIEGNPVDLDALAAFCRQQEEGDVDVVLAEGIGGIMVPLTDRLTVLDLLGALNWPVILVAGSYLGAISHTLTAVEAMKARQLHLHSVVLCESYYRAISMDDTAATIEKFLPETVPVLKIPRITTAANTWEHTPPISGMCG